MPEKGARLLAAPFSDSVYYLFFKINGCADKAFE